MEKIITEQALKGYLVRIATKVMNELGVSENVVVIVVLKAAFVFAADLIRLLPRNVRVEFVKAESYGNEQQAVKDVEVDLLFDAEVLKDQTVLVVDTVYDTGETMKAVTKLVSDCGASKVVTCSLLDKMKAVPGPDIVGLSGSGIGFVVGYGMDLAQTHRGLPFVEQV
jgi:hypoxanthine phosphoribosyltransferase